MTGRVVCGCGRAITDAARLCDVCTRRLRQDLAEIPALVEELETTRLRQSRTGGSPIGGGHSSERPLPYDDRPADAAKALLRVLRDWAQMVVDGRRVGWPRDLIADYSRFLLLHLDWLREQPSAEGLPDLHAAVGRARSTIDRRADRLYAGPCGSLDYASNSEPILCSAPCKSDVYGRVGGRVATCDVCGARHDLKDRREWMLDAAQDQLVTAVELSRFLTLYGDHVTPERIYKWAERGRLLPRGERPAVGERRPAALFRVGDARELLEQLAEKPTKKAG